MSDNEQVLIDLIRKQDRKTAAAREMPLLDPVYPPYTGIMLGLSRVIAVWPMSSLSPDAATVRDIAGGGLHLTNNNSTSLTFTSLFPYGSYTSASSMYLSRAHGADIASTGSQWWSTWIYPTASPGTTQGILGKFVTSTNDRSWRIVKDASDQITIQVSNLGTAIDASVVSAAVALNAWYHVFGLFLASSSLSVWVNGTRTDNTTSIPAALYNATGAAVELGRTSGAGYWDGRIGPTMLGRAVGTLAAWDVWAKHIFHSTRWMVGL